MEQERAVNMANSQETELLTRIAWMYYYGKMNHEDIAKVLGLSRIKVTRSLKAAHEAGIIEITIRSEYASLLSLEAQIKELTGLQYCIVVPTIADLADSLCRGTAHLFNDILKYTGSLGVGLSSTLKNLSRYINKEKNSFSSVVSICGAANPRLAYSPMNIGLSIAEALSIDFYTIWAPLIVADDTDNPAIKRDKYISMVLDMAAQVDVALIGIGNIVDSQLMQMGYISSKESDSIIQSGCVGEIIGNYFTIDGHKVSTSIDKRLISVKFPMKCPVIGVAGGAKKVRAIVGAMKSGLIQGLVTDERTAEEILQIFRKFIIA